MNAQFGGKREDALAFARWVAAHPMFQVQRACLLCSLGLVRSCSLGSMLSALPWSYHRGHAYPPLQLQHKPNLSLALTHAPASPSAHRASGSTALIPWRTTPTRGCACSTSPTLSPWPAAWRACRSPTRPRARSQWHPRSGSACCSRCGGASRFLPWLYGLVCVRSEAGRGVEAHAAGGMALTGAAAVCA